VNARKRAQATTLYDASHYTRSRVCIDALMVKPVWRSSSSCRNNFLSIVNLLTVLMVTTSGRIIIGQPLFFYRTPMEIVYSIHCKMHDMCHVNYSVTGYIQPHLVPQTSSYQVIGTRVSVYVGIPGQIEIQRVKSKPYDRTRMTVFISMTSFPLRLLE
jgi:hypothetical protein